MRRPPIEKVNGQWVAWEVPGAIIRWPMDRPFPPTERDIEFYKALAELDRDFPADLPDVAETAIRDAALRDFEEETREWRDW